MAIYCIEIDVVASIITLLTSYNRVTYADAQFADVFRCKNRDPFEIPLVWGEAE